MTSTLLARAARRGHLELELGDGSRLTLDYRDPQQPVGWRLLGRDGRCLRELATAEAIELAPDSRDAIVDATLDSLAESEKIVVEFDCEDDSPVALQSDRLAC